MSNVCPSFHPDTIPAPAPVLSLVPPPLANTEPEIFALAASGDGAAFGEIVRRHRPKLLGFATRMLGNRADAEDAVQEAFVKAFGAIARFRCIASPHTWLVAILKNVCLSKISGRRRARSGEDVTDPFLDMEISEKRPSPSPYDHANGEQMRVALNGAAAKLSETLRATITLVCVDGLSGDDAARVLGVPAGTVSCRVHMARGKLRDALSGRGFGSGGVQ